ncbi:MAG TPA: hypothetical protein VH459_09530 [Gaiellales bacterium]|jgi:hypothetical protein
MTSISYRLLTALLVVDAALLGTSGIPAIKDADSGWKNLIGVVAWGGFLVVSLAAVAVAAAVLLRRNRTAA